MALLLFYSYHNLQGSQTGKQLRHCNAKFYSYHNLQGSQTQITSDAIECSFTLIIIYKVLKRTLHIII